MKLDRSIQFCQLNEYQEGLLRNMDSERCLHATSAETEDGFSSVRSGQLAIASCTPVPWRTGLSGRWHISCIRIILRVRHSVLVVRLPYQRALT